LKSKFIKAEDSVKKPAYKKSCGKGKKKDIKTPF
jgi:hypothetical protein